LPGQTLRQTTSARHSYRKDEFRPLMDSPHTLNS
jgi:hypothetical protein